MRISDWSSDVYSSDLDNGAAQYRRSGRGAGIAMGCRRLYSPCLWRLPQFSDLRNSWRAFPDQPDIAGTDPDHIDDDPDAFARPDAGHLRGAGRLRRLQRTGAGGGGGGGLTDRTRHSERAGRGWGPGVT